MRKILLLLLLLTGCAASPERTWRAGDIAINLSACDSIEAIKLVVQYGPGSRFGQKLWQQGKCWRWPHYLEVKLVEMVGETKRNDTNYLIWRAINFVDENFEFFILAIENEGPHTGSISIWVWLSNVSTDARYLSGRS